nr:CRISPR-associated exonuclease Cas4 [uncultured archaeon]
MTSNEKQNAAKLFDITLESKKLGLITKADCIIFNNEKSEAYPVQHKYSYKPEKLYKSQMLQLLMEATIIEEQFNVAVPYGFIKFEKSKETVKVDLPEKQKLLESISAIKSIIETEQFPEPTEWKKRCTDCCYKRMCWG